MKELNIGDAVIRLIPEGKDGVWSIPAQMQIENGFDEVCVDLDRDGSDALIDALKYIKYN